MFTDAVIPTLRPTTMIAVAEVGCAVIWTRAGRAGEGVSS